MFEKLEMCDRYEVPDNGVMRAVAPSMRRYWEGEFVRLGRVPKHLLKYDVSDLENA